MECTLLCSTVVSSTFVRPFKQYLHAHSANALVISKRYFLSNIDPVGFFSQGFLLTSKAVAQGGGPRRWPKAVAQGGGALQGGGPRTWRPGASATVQHTGHTSVISAYVREWQGARRENKSGTQVGNTSASACKVVLCCFNNGDLVDVFGRVRRELGQLPKDSQHGCSHSQETAFSDNSTFIDFCLDVRRPLWRSAIRRHHHTSSPSVVVVRACVRDIIIYLVQ